MSKSKSKTSGKPTKSKPAEPQQPAPVPEAPEAPKAPDPIKWKQAEKTETVGVSVFARWVSEDGLYRVCRITGIDKVRYGAECRTDNRWDTVQREGSGGNYPKFYESMIDAVSVCVLHGKYDGSDAAEVMGVLMSPVAELGPTKARKESTGPRTPRTPGEVRPSNMGTVYLAWVVNPETPAEKLFELTDGGVRLETVHHWLKCWARGYKFPAVAKQTAAK